MGYASRMQAMALLSSGRQLPEQLEEKRPERRKMQRQSVDCPACFETHSGVLDVRLSDLSRTGARFDTDTPPGKGASGLLCWNGEEFFGSVVWIEDGSCGFVFERPIPQAVFNATVYVEEIELGPVANFGNIPVASRRRRGLVAGG